MKNNMNDETWELAPWERESMTGDQMDKLLGIKKKGVTSRELFKPKLSCLR